MAESKVSDKDFKDLKDKTEKSFQSLGTNPRTSSPMVEPVNIPRIARDGHPILKKEKR
jgi:hypothetical protein